jgi:putative cell wall-binding protein
MTKNILILRINSYEINFLKGDDMERMKRQTKKIFLLTGLALTVGSLLVVPPSFAQTNPLPRTETGMTQQQKFKQSLDRMMIQRAESLADPSTAEPYTDPVEYKGEVNEGILHIYRFQTVTEGTINLDIKTGFERLNYYISSECEEGQEDCPTNFYKDGDTLPAGKYALFIKEDFLNDQDPRDDYVNKPYHFVISGLTFAGRPDTTLPLLNITSPAEQRERLPLGSTSITFTGDTNATKAYVHYMEDGEITISGKFSFRLGKEEASYGGVYFYAYNANGNMLNIDYHPLFPEFKRVDGKDRYEVAVNSNIAMVEALQENVHDGFDPTGRTIVISSGTQFADALGAGAYAANKVYSFFLTPSAGLTQQTIDRIRQLQPKQAVIVGGTSSVSTHVEKQLRDLSIGVSRIDGKDRYEVATGIASKFKTSGDTAIIASGQDFADALSVSAVSGRHNMPLLLTTAKSLPASVVTFLKNHPNYTKFVIVGGPGSVSDNVASQLAAFGKVTRIGGKDRYEVAVNVAKYFKLEPHHFLVARGDVFSDALSITPLAAFVYYGGASPILLTTTTALPPVVEQYLNENRYSLLRGYVGGGQASVPLEIEKKIKEMLSP